MPALALAYDLRTIDARSVTDHAYGMLKINYMKTLLATLAFVYLIAAGPVQAGLMGFTVESLKTEDSGGC